MKLFRLALSGAALLLACAAASAATVMTPFSYRVDFVSTPALSSALGLVAGSMVTGTATYDNAIPSAVQAGPAGYTEFDVSALAINFGSRSFTLADNTSLFGPVVGVGPVVSYLGAFSTTFTAGGQQYDLYFDPGFLGALQFQLYPQGSLDATFLQATGTTVIPVPGALPLMVAGLGMLGFALRRRAVQR